MHVNFCLESLKDSDHLEDLVKDERIVSEFMSEKKRKKFGSSTLILSSHLCLPLDSGLSPSGLPTKICLSSNQQRNKVTESLCLINPLTPELNPSAQRCLTRFLLGILLLEPCISLIYA
jgi:hypothetical protein